MDKIQNQDRTLDDDSFGAWMVAALESGMDPTEVNTVATARLRLLGAAAVASEILGEHATTACITELLRHIRAIRSHPSPNLYWNAQES